MYRTNTLSEPTFADTMPRESKQKVPSALEQIHRRQIVNFGINCAVNPYMPITFLIIGSLFTTGFVMMLREIVKAPVGCQDEQGFRQASAKQEAATPRPRSRRVRRHATDRPPFGALEVAPVR